jgi:hypothetical protein
MNDEWGLMRTSWVVRAALLSLLAIPVLAQDSPQDPTPPTAPAAAGAQQPVVEYARVRNAHSHTATSTVGLGDRLIIEVENFPKLLADAGGNCGGIVLFLEGMPMAGLPPESCDVQSGSVRFILKRNDKNDAAWHWLLGSPKGFLRTIRVTVGPNETNTVPTMVNQFPLRVVPRALFYIWLLVTVGALILFLYLCRNTALIRGARTAALPAKSKPYSLARFQMAYWFFLVIAAYLFMWILTGELDTITDSILALIGIGAGTALGSALIDSNANADSAVKTAVTADEGAVTKGFLRDVLDDGGGISFHRFQMFVWTLVLGIIFVSSVYIHLAMPEFSATMLGLMGISSGTYLGFKFPEKTNREAVDVAATPPPPDPPPAG